MLLLGLFLFALCVAVEIGLAWLIAALLLATLKPGALTRLTKARLLFLTAVPVLSVAAWFLFYSVLLAQLDQTFLVIPKTGPSLQLAAPFRGEGRWLTLLAIPCLALAGWASARFIAWLGTIYESTP